MRFETCTTDRMPAAHETIPLLPRHYVSSRIINCSGPIGLVSVVSNTISLVSSVSLTLARATRGVRRYVFPTATITTGAQFSFRDARSVPLMVGTRRNAFLAPRTTPNDTIDCVRLREYIFFYFFINVRQYGSTTVYKQTR